jgi:tetratricopeptide (TPR) repeat protein
LVGAYQEMGQAHYQLGNYERSVEASESALRIATGFPAYNTLGLAQMSLQHWSEAKTAFQGAINKDRNRDWQWSYWQARFSWALCVNHLNEAQTEIRKAEAEIKSASRIKKGIGMAGFYSEAQEFQIVQRRIDLALLCWLTGDKQGSQMQIAILRSEDATAAAALQKLLATQAARTN